MSFLKRLFSSDNPSQPPQNPHSNLNWDQLVERAMSALRIQTDAHDQTWGIGAAAWSLDQDTGNIVFETEKGYTATAPFQIVGSYNTQDGSWLWGWANNSIDPALQIHARTAYDHGKNAGFETLTTRKLAISEDQAWELSAVTSLLSQAQGTFRCPMGPTLVFVTLGQVQLSGSGREPDSIDEEPNTDLKPDPELTADQVPQDILEIVKGYIADYYRWNQAAMAAGTPGDLDEATTLQVEKANKAVIDKWFGPGSDPQSYSYGTESAHDPARETIIGATISGDTAVVYSTHGGKYSGEDRFEYHFAKADGAWKLKKILYVDDYDKYESQ